MADLLTQVRALIDQAADPGEPAEDRGHPFEATPAVGAALMADAVRVVQGLLAAAGHAPGLADGIWGERTQAAYTAFLREARR